MASTRLGPWSLAPLGLLVALAAAACSCGGGATNPDSAPPPCTAGERRCDGNALQACEGGAFVTTETCDMACDPTLGCVTCVPDTGTCDEGTAIRCNSTGTAVTRTFCDPVQGMSCDSDLGECRGVCSPAQLGANYIGCEYYPTVTANWVDPTYFAFAITVSNTGTETAEVTIDGANAPARPTVTVEPGQVAVIRLPWTEALTIPWGYLPGDAYRVRSTQPVTVYQFNALDYVIVDEVGYHYSFTNDASLLLPAHRLGTDYVLASYPGGILTVTALRDQTHVTIVATVDFPAENGAPALVTGQPVTTTMQRGDTLHIGGGSDLTATRITADTPIQVLSAHPCTYVPVGMPACDHLEESMFPVATLGRHYAVTNPAVPPLPDGKEQVIRVVAVENDTHVTFDPPMTGLAPVLQAGQYFSIDRHLGDFVVSADKRFLVAQYMEGQSAGGDTGDPALTLAVATDQYRTSYLFHAPANYEVNYVNITAPVGTTVTVDGESVMVEREIGDSGVGVVRHPLGAGTDGNHTATSDERFGISVYGYGQYTSYWYPGGLDLKQLVD